MTSAEFDHEESSTAKIKHMDELIAALIVHVPEVSPEVYNDNMSLKDVLMGKIEEIQHLHDIIIYSLKY